MLLRRRADEPTISAGRVVWSMSSRQQPSRRRLTPRRRMLAPKLFAFEALKFKARRTDERGEFSATPQKLSTINSTNPMPANRTASVTESYSSCGENPASTDPGGIFSLLLGPYTATYV